MLIVYVLAFYVVTYVVFGSVMLTVGAAVIRWPRRRH